MSFTVTFLGHASFVITTDQATILLDPWLDENPQASAHSSEVVADYILVSHGHSDHLGDTIPIAKRTGATIITNVAISRWLQGQGLENIERMNLGGGLDLPFGRVQMTIAHHDSQLPDGTYGGNPAGFLITVEGAVAYFACDTALFTEMQLYGNLGLDFAALPIGDRFTMGPDDALTAVQMLRPKKVMPCHFNTFPLIEQDGEAWVERVNAETDSEAVLMHRGQSVVLVD